MKPVAWVGQNGRKACEETATVSVGQAGTWGGAGMGEKMAEVVSSKLSQKSLRAVGQELGEGGGVFWNGRWRPGMPAMRRIYGRG